MQQLGFCYKAQEKGYYVDGHEKPATIEYCWAFIKWYLEYEQHMFCWIQIPLAEALKLEDEGKIPKSSVYRYADENMGKEMVEYHVDAC